MARSNSLSLVNTVLSRTGDFPSLSTLLNSPANIAGKIVGMMNTSLAKIESVTAWPQLRITESFIANGGSTVFTYTGAEDISPTSIISVYIAGGDSLVELTDQQLDRVKSHTNGTTPRYFRRSFIPSNNTNSQPSIEIYPTPPINAVITVTYYARATRFSINSDTSKTDFDDELVLAGALYYSDLYDGLDRGYKAIFDELLSLVARDNSRNTLHVTIDDWFRVASKNPNAWNDSLFIEAWQREHEEYYSQV